MMRAQAQYNDSKFGELESNEEKRNISKDLALNSYNSINKMIEKMRVTNGLPNEEISRELLPERNFAHQPEILVPVDHNVFKFIRIEINGFVGN